MRDMACANGGNRESAELLCPLHEQRAHNCSHAGMLSTWGFTYLSPFLEAKLGLKDTCGVHNLHGMPGVFGGLVPILPLLLAGEGKAACAQIAALGATVGIAVAGGAIHAFFVHCMGNASGNALTELMYEDAAIFEGEDEDSDKA